MRSTAKCEACGVRTLWDITGWIVDEEHDARGRECRCCGSRRVTTLYHIAEDGSTTIVRSWTEGKFFPRGSEGIAALRAFLPNQQED